MIDIKKFEEKASQIINNLKAKEMKLWLIKNNNELKKIKNENKH